MKQAQQTLSVATAGRGLYEVTDAVASLVDAAGVDIGVCLVFCKHTSCSLMIQENADPAVARDMIAWLERIAPDGDPLYTHTAEGPDDMPAHVKASLLGCSVTLPVRDGRLALGTWQGIYLCEHRNHATRRRILLTLQGERTSDG